jgi:hypothetical protein
MARLTPTPSADYPVDTASIEELATALRGIITKGLPIQREADVGWLLMLRSVYARAVIPSEGASRLSALNELLPRLLATIADSSYREAVQQLFGLFPGSRGTTLTARRRQAATTLSYSPGHFREVIESEALEAVALIIQTDLLRYRARTRRSAGSLEPTGQAPQLGPEHLTHYDELISRIWQHVYGLRAELIAHGRLSEEEGLASQAEDHRQAVLRQEAELQRLLGEFAETYGPELLRHGEAEYSVEAVERLAGWRL